MKNFYKENNIFFLALIITLIYLTQLLFFGIGIDFDSNYYISASESFTKDLTFKNPDGSDFVLWPPFFPFVLSILPFSIRVNIIIINTLSLFIINFLTLKYARQILNILFFRVSVLGMLFSVPLFLDYKFLWSEMLFTALLLIYLDNFFKLLKSEVTNTSLIISTFIGILLPLQRIATFYLWIGLWLSSIFLFPKLRMKLFFHFILTSSVGITWNIYTLILLGARDHFNSGNIEIIINNINEYSFVLIRWFFPISIITSTPTFIIPIICLIFIILTISIGRSKEWICIKIMIFTYFFLMIVTPFYKVFGGGLQEAERFSSITYPFILIFILYVFQKIYLKYRVVLFIVLFIVFYQLIRWSKSYYEFHNIHSMKLSYIEKLF